MENFLILDTQRIDAIGVEFPELYYENLRVMTHVQRMFNFTAFMWKAPPEKHDRYPTVPLYTSSVLEEVASSYVTVGAAFSELRYVYTSIKEHDRMGVLFVENDKGIQVVGADWVYDIRLLADLIIQFYKLTEYPENLIRLTRSVRYTPYGALELLYRSIDRDMYLEYNDINMVEIINYLTRSNYPLQDPHGACLFAWYIIYRVMDYVNFKEEK